MSLTKPKNTDRLNLGGLPEYLPAYCGDFDAVIDAVNDIIDGTQSFAEHITNTTQSTSDSTGALIVDGGVGIVKDVFVTGKVAVAGTIVSSGTTDSTTSTTGDVKTAGGIGIAKAANIGTTLGVAGLATLTAGATFNARNTYKGVTSITAFAGGGQGSATALTGEQNNVTVCATVADSVVLPAATLGARMFVKNNGAADLAVFPFTSGTINGGAANTSITIPVGATKLFEGTSTTNWESLGVLATASGTAARPSHTFNSQSNQGLYSVSSTQLGVAVSGALVGGFNANGLFTDVITPQTTGAGTSLQAPVTPWLLNLSPAITASGAVFLANATTTTVANTITLPACSAGGVGTIFKIKIIKAVTAGGTYVVNTTGTDVFLGGVYGTVAVPNATNDAIFASSTANKTLTLNATTTGGLIGGWLEFTMISATQWSVSGVTLGTGTQATPFSN